MLPFIYRGHDQRGFFLQGWSLGGADLLRPAPGNQPPAGEPYLCVVPLRDAWRADQHLTERLREPHFSAALEPQVLDDLRAGRALLLLDISNEGPGFPRQPVRLAARLCAACQHSVFAPGVAGSEPRHAPRLPRRLRAG